ncbi:MAG: CoB--CoM heterodisulfide reductase iron-sulfur subunit A family protein [Acidobacteriia bacterium]|nr:CoB--CoM heterodisulfide reductase iron-sulfur subunit A family protein [Terriglobia bacterium]
MGTPTKVGIFFCREGTALPDGVDLADVARYSGGLPGVVHVEDRGLKPRLDPEALAWELKRKDIKTVVIAGDSPGYFKQAFTRALALSGGDPSEVRLASFLEHGALAAHSAERAKAIIACAVHGVPFGLAAVPQSTPVNPVTLVVGGGVAGIQASLEIADAGQKVILLEKTGTIGGHMAMFDKTFPTLDCAACILTPKMVAIAQHPMIELMTCSEIREVSGAPGAFRVKVLKRARYVDLEACVSCHACMEVCPVVVPSEFDNGITTRKAIYMPFPQAVPNTYLIDRDTCTYLLSDGKKCGACLRKCAKEGIHFDEKDEVVEIEVGNIIVATGYDVFDARRIERFGYGVHPNVVSALEFERLTNASGPTGGAIVMKTLKHNKRKKADEWVFDPEGPRPKSVAILHCVGSRDRNYNSYCSRVCCMYSLKFAHLVREKLPDAACYEFYIDMRAFGKGYEEFFERIKHEEVFVVRGRSAKITEKEGRMLLKGEDILSDRVVEFPVDMVILSVGLEPAKGADDLARCVGVSRDEDGWFTEMDYNIEPTSTERGGIFVAGVCQGPKDIPDTVAQASAVAARVLKSIVSGFGQGSRASLSLEEIEARARTLAAS